jgi:hypothetical protein
MRETPRSLRAYFIIVGLLGGLVYTAQLVAGVRLAVSPAADLVAAWILVVLILVALVKLAACVGFLYAGITLRRYLDKGDPRRILKIILFSGGAYVFTAVVGILAAKSLGGELGAGNLGGTVVGLLITWYLYVNTRRLARESMEARKMKLEETFR